MPSQKARPHRYQHAAMARYVRACTTCVVDMRGGGGVCWRRNTSADDHVVCEVAGGGDVHNHHISRVSPCQHRRHLSHRQQQERFSLEWVRPSAMTTTPVFVHVQQDFAEAVQAVREHSLLNIDCRSEVMLRQIGWKPWVDYLKRWTAVHACHMTPPD